MAKRKSVLHSNIDMVNVATMLAVALVSGIVGYFIGQASVLGRF